ncbi:hypothetical protein L1987_57602 [Smallanthus sonchifolius]|uniref:Uncharacterized protein n=1 Tax=Smallanthus sonchifolius TaxID=185202 RepID=A0ACB9DCY4_9ASTR|nr:hypothetical protein L1987_57602 [Smallanthus sonchifolius]
MEEAWTGVVDDTMLDFQQLHDFRQFRAMIVARTVSPCQRHSKAVVSGSDSSGVMETMSVFSYDDQWNKATTSQDRIYEVSNHLLILVVSQYGMAHSTYYDEEEEEIEEHNKHPESSDETKTDKFGREEGGNDIHHEEGNMEETTTKEDQHQSKEHYEGKDHKEHVILELKTP